MIRVLQNDTHSTLVARPGFGRGSPYHAMSNGARSFPCHGHMTAMVAAHHSYLYHGHMTAVVAARPWSWLIEEKTWPAYYR